MKLQFKQQNFQTEAVNAICNIFAGQPKIERQKYIKDIGTAPESSTDDVLNQVVKEVSQTGYNNAFIKLADTHILDNVKHIQRSSNNIKPSEKIESYEAIIEKDGTKKKDKKAVQEKVLMKYNFTVEMETGTGKTYTYIKTMYELNAKYGWAKFIVVVPSVAIREGVFATFNTTQEHFSQIYNKKIRYFIYNSSNLPDIDSFASDPGINVMIINSQAFNAKGEDARRIYKKLDSFRSRRPIDILSKTNPILIIDEPQSVEGTATKNKLGEFKPLFILRYSATHKEAYNMVYRLDALDAYNKKLVKKIAVKSVSITGSTATEGYLYLQKIILSDSSNPQAMIEFEQQGKNGIKKVVRKVGENYSLYENSKLDQYKGYTVSDINGSTKSVSFTNGKVIYTGDVQGTVNEEQLRRIQIRQTILSHLEKEKELFYKGVKVISLFFIDEVAKYRLYDEDSNSENGEYATVFEEEYNSVINEQQLEFSKDAYYDYLKKIPATTTHKGYFSIDKNKKTGKEKFIDGSLERDTKLSNDSDAYDLIMKDKERLLSIDEPVRFIFSHSALREGWDNPNVFQICTLKDLSNSDIRTRQEIGRGLRLSVNNNGERMDSEKIGADVHTVNKLTVITDLKFELYVKTLQKEIAEIVADRPVEVNTALFENRTLKIADGSEITVTHDLAMSIYENLISEGYVKKGKLTDKFFEEKEKGAIVLDNELTEYKESIIEILDLIFDPIKLKIDNDNDTTVTLKINKSNYNKKEFLELWKRINKKSAYTVHFDEQELISKAITNINNNLNVSQIYFSIVTGEMKQASKQELEAGEAFTKNKGESNNIAVNANSSVKYDLIGKITSETSLTRECVVKILKGINSVKFDQFSQNPEEFILLISKCINEEKATVIINHITYNMLDKTFNQEDLFTAPEIKGTIGVNALETPNKNIYDHLKYDSQKEKDMVQELEIRDEVCVYAKLPSGFYIDTPVGKYNPDWAIAFKEGKVKHIYFVAETKGSMQEMYLRDVERLKKKCAIEHFKAISSDTVKYNIVSTYDELYKKVMGE